MKYADAIRLEKKEKETATTTKTPHKKIYKKKLKTHFPQPKKEQNTTKK